MSFVIWSFNSSIRPNFLFCDAFCQQTNTFDPIFNPDRMIIIAELFSIAGDANRLTAGKKVIWGDMNLKWAIKHHVIHSWWDDGIWINNSEKGKKTSALHRVDLWEETGLLQCLTHNFQINICLHCFTLMWNLPLDPETSQNAEFFFEASGLCNAFFPGKNSGSFFADLTCFVREKNTHRGLRASRV